MKLLEALYNIYAPTGREWPMIEFVLRFLDTQVPEAQYQLDAWGNIYIKKSRRRKENDVQQLEGYPTLCCHLDQAQKIHSEEFKVKIRTSCDRSEEKSYDKRELGSNEANDLSDGDEKILLNSGLDVSNDVELFGWSETQKSMEGLGADDKNGIWICLRVLQQCDHLKVFMSVGEEKGCWGSNRADLSFFKDSLYILEPDCKGGEEIRTLLKGVPVASKEFEEALQADKFGYVITEGKTTDILPLTISGVGVSCANLPCGYHNPHKADEYCNVSELAKCLDFVLHTVRNLNSKFPHKYITPTRKWVEGKIIQRKES